MTVKSNFKLDDRIKSIDDIQTIICNNHGFIGCKGFFFDQLVQTKNLTKCHYGTLVDIDINGYNDDHCFKARDENGNDFVGYYRFFLPESLVLKESKEKKWRAYTIAEFQETFTVGRAVRFRRKDAPTQEHLLVFVGYYTLHDGSVSILFGIHFYTLEELFEQYEWQEFYTDEYRPFGIKE